MSQTADNTQTNSQAVNKHETHSTHTPTTLEINTHNPPQNPQHNHSSNTQHITIALIGQPNVGKSSLINAISGSHLKVGNFSGVTIEKTQAHFVYKNTHITIIDLPGSYSLNHYSPEEKITKDFLESRQYDIVLNVLDSTNLARNLALSGQIMDLGVKMVLGLNMIDEAKAEHIQINHTLLSEILGVPCVPVSASTGENLSLLLDTLISTATKPLCATKRIYNDTIEKAIAHIENFITQRDFYELQAYPSEQAPLSARQLAILLMKRDRHIYAYLHDKPSYHDIAQCVSQACEKLCAANDEQNITRLFHHDAIAYAQGAAQESTTYPKTLLEKTKNMDELLLHKVFGIPIFLGFMFVLFEMTFYVGGFFKDYIELGFDMLSSTLKEVIVVKEFASLVCDGIIGGVGTIVSFLPLIMVLYFGIAILESSGYMARIAFLLDGFFHRFGLHGKSFIPLVAGFGCSVPAYMATRTLKNRNERLITLFVIGFMSCSARLPIYVLFIGAFFEARYAGVVLFGVYLFGALVALLLAKFLKLTIFAGYEEPFVMEMPKYRMPNWKVVWFSVWSKVVMFLKKAAGFIFLGSVLIWFASQYPKSPTLATAYEEKKQALISSQAYQAKQIQEQEQELWYLYNEYNEEFLRQTYSGRIGEALRPFFAPLGFDWRLSIALVSGFAAKEVVVSTLGILYALGDDTNEEDASLQQNLQDTISFPSAIAFIVFVMFYIPCFAATITFGREAGGVKFVLYLFIFTTIVAYLFALLGFFLADVGYGLFVNLPQS